MQEGLFKSIQTSYLRVSGDWGRSVQTPNFIWLFWHFDIWLILSSFHSDWFARDRKKGQVHLMYHTFADAKYTQCTVNVVPIQGQGRLQTYVHNNSLINNFAWSIALQSLITSDRAVEPRLAVVSCLSLFKVCLYLQQDKSIRDERNKWFNWCKKRQIVCKYLQNCMYCSDTLECC